MDCFINKKYSIIIIKYFNHCWCQNNTKSFHNQKL